MKTTRNVLFALLFLGVSAGAASAQPSVGAEVNVAPRGHASVDLGFFYDNLAQYGNWIQRPNHGWVWTPRDVSASWRPYQAGHWVWSDQGWTWLSDEPYGWATYHYGRWYQDPEIGWAWVPGTDWAPAWVSWQEGNDYVGWAPLPPGATVNASYNPGPGNAPGGNAGNNGGYDNGGYNNGNNNGPAYDNNPPYDNQGYDNPPYDNNAGTDNGPVYDNGPGYDSAPVYDNGYGYDGGYSYGGGYGYANYAYGIAPAAYLFVPTRSFLALDLFDFFVPWVRVSSFWGFTHNCTDYGFYGGRYFNRGIPFEHVHRFYGNVPRYRLSELGGFRGRGFQVEGNRLAFFRPQVNRSWHGSPLDRAGARRSVVTAGQFRNEHPDRQRSYAQTSRQNFGRNDGRNAQRGYQQGYPSRQAQGDRNGQHWQGQGQDRANRQGFYNGNGQRGQDQASRQRAFENGRVQTQRGQQDQARQRSYDNQRFQAQADRQRQYSAQQQQYRQQRSYDNQRGQQRQAPPQRQQYRGDSGRGQANHGQTNRGQNNHGHGNDRRQHGG